MIWLPDLPGPYTVTVTLLGLIIMISSFRIVTKQSTTIRGLHFSDVSV